MSKSKVSTKEKWEVRNVSSWKTGNRQEERQVPTDNVAYIVRRRVQG